MSGGGCRKPDWVRPNGPHKLWKTIDGYEMMLDGTCSMIIVFLKSHMKHSDRT